MPRPKRPLKQMSGPGPGDREAASSSELRVNRRIRVPRVLVIDENGGKLGEFLTEDALRIAQERGLDLVEVSPNAYPPVCRIADFGKMKYEKKKKETQARRNQVLVQLKEVKLRPKTDEHDMDFKVRHARRFLEEGNKVKVTVRFRGREMAHREIGEEQCLEFFEACKDLCTVEMTPRMEGKAMFMILATTRKKVPKPPREIRREGRDEGDEPEEDDEDLDDLTDDTSDEDDDTSEEEDDTSEEEEGDDASEEAVAEADEA
ncbi:MAG: hypothetical protein RLZZ383_134 [Pseudomonadota bacterium]